MRRFLFYILSLIILITCTKDVFEEETEAPIVFFNVEAAASQGGSVDNAGGSLASGSTLTITATPESEYLFTGWTGTSSTENPLTITVNSNLTITANFEKRKYPLTINLEGEGTVTEEIVSTAKSTDYDSGTVVKLTAVPSDGHALMRWNNNGVLDTLNPIQITIDSNKTVDVNFDYQTARDLVGTWEFDLQESETAKSHGKIMMRVSIELNILFTMILNNVTTQIYTKLNSLNSSNLVMGNFGVLTNINFSSPTSISFNVITLPPNSAPPTTAAAIPSPTTSNSISLTGGNKTSSNSAPFIPPTTAVTSSTSGISPTQALSSVVSQVATPAVLATTASSTTASTTASSCTISGTLTSGPQSQTVSISTAITNVVGTFTYTCSDTLSITASGLPTGVALSTSGNVATISGTPTGAASGTYNYLVSAVNSTGTASASYSGDITVSVASSTLVPCSGSLTLTSGPSTQTVSASTAITSVNYLVSTNCTDTTTVSATNLPPGVTMNYTSSSGAVVVSGTPSGAATGTYNYSILAMFAPTSDATASATISGAISIAVATSTSTTASSSKTFNIGVNATSSSDYTLNGDDRNGTVTGGDPNLTFNTGDTINFNVDATGHPFYLKTVAGTGTGNTITGLTNNGTTNQTVSWTPSSTGTYYYQCSLHGGMVGTITIQ